MIASAKSFAARSWSCSNPSHTGLTTRLQYEHVQELQELEEELKENNMKWDVIGLGEVRRKEESFTTIRCGHLLYYLVNKKWKDNITRVSAGNSE